MGQKRSRIIGLSLALGLMAAAFATGAAAQTSTQAEAAWRSVKTYMEAGPMLLGSTSPILLRLTGEPCNTRLVPIDGSGPMSEGGLMQWRMLGRASAQPVEGGHVVAFANGGWFAFPPFEAAQAQAAAAALDALVQACEAQPSPVGRPANDHYADLEAVFQRLKTELEAVVATDTASRRFTYKIERATSVCHFNAMKMEPGTQSGWLEDNTLYMAPGMTMSSINFAPGVLVDQGMIGNDYLLMDSRTREQRVIALLTEMRDLCTEFRAPRG